MTKSAAITLSTLEAQKSKDLIDLAVSFGVYDPKTVKRQLRKAGLIALIAEHLGLLEAEGEEDPTDTSDEFDVATPATTEVAEVKPKTLAKARVLATDPLSVAFACANKFKNERLGRFIGTKASKMSHEELASWLQESPRRGYTAQAWTMPGRKNQKDVYIVGITQEHIDTLITLLQVVLKSEDGFTLMAYPPCPLPASAPAAEVA